MERIGTKPDGHRIPINRNVIKATRSCKNKRPAYRRCIWRNYYVDDRTIDSHIKRLRRKFKSFDENFDEIETIYGIGYRYKNIKEKLET